MMKRIGILFCLVSSINANSQDLNKFSPDKLKTDFKIFKGSLEDFHPGFYWYRSRQEIEDYFGQIESNLNESLTEKEYLRQLTQAVAFIGCGHTWISPSKENASKKFLPLRIKFIDNGAYYANDFSDDTLALERGDKIIKINGIKVDSLYELTRQYTPGDGFIKTGKSAGLDEFFWYSLSIHLLDDADQFTIFVDSQSSGKKEMKIRAVTLEEYFRNIKKISIRKDDLRNITLHFDSITSTAVMKIFAFFDWKEGKKKIKFERRLQDLFESIEDTGVDNLIIDLRGNGGGKVPWVLYSYFVDEKFVFAKSADFIYSKSSPYIQYQKLHPSIKWIKKRWLYTWYPGSSKMAKVEGKRYKLTNLYLTKPYKPSQPKFQGKVYLITDGGSFSATSDFAAMMKSYDRAIIIGEETGGGYYGNTSMEKSTVTLPNTKLRLEIPLVRHQINVNEKVPHGRGVIPDHEIRDSLKDFLTNTDAQMEFTMSLIKK